MLDDIVVSTDDEETRGISLAWGARVHNRPAWLSADDASPYDLVRYMIRECKAEYVMLLQPTSPFRTAQHINEVLPKIEAPIQSVNIETGEANGAIYYAKAGWWRDLNFNFDTSSNVVKYQMPAELSLDINTLEEFEAGESAPTPLR